MGSGPCMCTLRMPSRFNSPLAVALPIVCSESISDWGGRWMSLVVIGGLVILVSGMASKSQATSRATGDCRLLGGMAHGVRAVHGDDALLSPVRRVEQASSGA